MKKQFRILLLAIGVGLVPLFVSPVHMHAQVNEIQRAHDAGYENGVNAARQNKPMNLNTGDWHGDRLTAYQRGYEEGYRSVRPGGAEGWRSYQDKEDQRAWQAGFENGRRDHEHGRPMNLNNGNWHGDRLEIYRRGYEEGYHGHR
jgi:hypothetical protein